MGRSPFIAKELSSQARGKQRRSTRIDYITPIILSGRDATGQAFREETQTSIVNLHGSKVLTHYQVMVGMIVSVEVVRTGQAGKAVCVQVYEPAPGETIHHIAVQLVQPANIWGVENPPPDWDAVEAELGGARHAATMANPRASVIGMKPVLEAAAIPPSTTDRAQADAQFADFEKRSARLMDSVLEILRIQADAAVRNSLQEVEKRMDDITVAGESRLRERAEQAGVELEMTLETFRTEAMGELVREAVQGFQQRLDALSKEAELRITRRAEQATADFEATLRAGQQKQGTQAAEAEAKVSRVAEQALAKIESSRENLQQLQEKTTAEGEAHMARRSEQVLADFEARLQTTQQRQESKASEAEGKISRLAEQAIAKIEASQQNFQQVQEKTAADGDARIQHSSNAAVAELEAKLQTAQQRQGTQAAEAEARISRVAEQAMADFEAALQTFRADVGDELAARREEVVKSTEQTLRTRLAALLSTIITAPAVEPATSPADSKSKK